MKKNKGFSLVELLVAISIAAIVAGSIGFLLTTSLRMYNNETTDVALQQELQMTLNQIVDYAMESQTVVVRGTDAATDYLALGTVDETNPADLKAEVFFTDGNRLYMWTGTISDYTAVQDTEPRNLDDKVKKIKNDAMTELNQHILADNVSSFIVKLNGTKIQGTEHLYENPLSIDITLEFKKKTTTKEVVKTVSDKAVLRNKLDTNIYVNGDAYERKKVALSIETTTVPMEERTGRILIEGSESAPKTSLNILEIIPDYSYEYVQYVIGGYNDKLNSYDNINYGASARTDYEYEVTPITPAEFEGFMIQTCGGTDNNNVTGISSYFPNDNDPDLQGVVLTADKERNGYYEYVGHDDGIYAISKYDVTGSVASASGMGDTKPIVISYTTLYDVPAYNPSDKDNYTEKIYNPVFRYCEYDEFPGQYYKAEVSATGRADYNKVFVDPEKEYLGYHYEYAGAGNGEYSLVFTRYNTKQRGNDYGPGDQSCYVVDDSYDLIDKENGQYYAYVSGWERRDLTGVSDIQYEKGYDFNQTVTSALMYSRYYSNSSAVSSDFGWVWREARPGTELYDGIDNGTYMTGVGALLGGVKQDGEEFARGTRLYLKGHHRYGIVNNELFKLFVMQDALEQYVDGSPKMLDIKNGRWDKTNDTYSSVNDSALKAWEAAGNKITVNARIPKDITAEDVASCDMVIIGMKGDGGFNSANVMYNKIRPSITTKDYSLSNDISFELATEIYKRVCAEEISIACPFEIDGRKDGTRELNLSKMYKMIYGVSNWTQSDTELLSDVVGKAKEQKIEEQGDNNYWSVDPDYMKDIDSVVMRKGSGRDLFKDFLLSIQDEDGALSKSLYENGTLEHKTTDFIYIDYDGNIVIPSLNQDSMKTHQRIGLTNHEYTIYRHDADILNNFDITANSGVKAFDKFEYTFLLKNVINNNFLLDRYRAEISRDANKYTVYPKTEFVYNEEYGYKYKFYYDSRHEGVYKNALLYVSTSNLFTFYKSGSKGLAQLGVASQNSHPMEERTTEDVIGTVEFVGADDVDSYDKRKAELDSLGSESMKYEDNPTQYSIRLSKLGVGTNKKVFYMSQADFEKAKTEGLYLYVLIKTSKDPTNYNKCVLKYHTNPEDGGTEGRFDYDAYNYDMKNNESSDHLIKYAAGGHENDNYVREYCYHANAEYFQHLSAPNNGGNNLITAEIKAGEGRLYQGSDELYFIIRDDFDLD